MTKSPWDPKLFHITHVENLPRIVEAGHLLSDRNIAQGNGAAQTIGMSTIKRRRLEEIEVTPHPGTRVGDYVPFYFCPRSVMLYVIHCANQPTLSYRGGQEPIVHLVADLRSVVGWADRHWRKWAFTRSNAGSKYVTFRSSLDDLEDLDWKAIGADDFRDPTIKEGKQAEFLLHQSFPFDLVDRIGVHSKKIQARASAALRSARHRPPIDVVPDWYF